MAEENFTEMGRIEAIARLFEGTGYSPWDGCSFDAGRNGGIVLKE